MQQDCFVVKIRSPMLILKICCITPQAILCLRYQPNDDATTSTNIVAGTIWWGHINVSIRLLEKRWKLAEMFSKMNILNQNPFSFLFFSVIVTSMLCRTIRIKDLYKTLSRHLKDYQKKIRLTILFVGQSRCHKVKLCFSGIRCIYIDTMLFWQKSSQSNINIFCFKSIQPYLDLQS